MALGGVFDLIQLLPQIISFSQYIFFGFTVLFFGSLSVRGIVSYTEWFIRWSLRILFGLFALIGGYALADVIPFGGLTQTFHLFQLDVLITGILVSIIYASGLYMISRNINRDEQIKKNINKLQEELKGVQTSGIRSPLALAGIVVILIVFLISVSQFTGFTNPLNDVIQELPLPGESQGGATLDIAKYCHADGEFIMCQIPLNDVKNVNGFS